MIDLTGPENFLLPLPYLMWFLPGVGPIVVREFNLGLMEDRVGDKFFLPPSALAGVGPKMDEESSLGLEVGEDPEENTSSSRTLGDWILLIVPTTKNIILEKM